MGTNPFYSAVGARIRAIREAAGMTQEEFAAAASMNAAFAGRVERGLQNLSLLTIGRAAIALSVPPAELFRDVQADQSLLRVPSRRKLVRKARAGTAQLPGDGPD
ncbi:helix-turn-helix domain-containing protein [Glacieibacterium megasporae]|uniref:helix-turn-helix domain-containing protein n=1 Tax=Glacieibacterium megasporae TaxID=2835787 RepID=UPI001C1E0232|nr:helix-turn-helix transcriptional regulator [Polymorphobacter megasporae]UAJ10623.1 helix-turn-helix domain-containing protein [Polymorphobacter megasporae]